MRDHDPITVRSFLGIYSRGDDDSVPPGYFKDSRNVRFITGGVKSRAGTGLDITMASVKRMAVYKRIGEAQRLLLLDAVGQLWDSTNLVTPILSIAAMSDFSVESMFNRAYITPHDGVTGLAGEKVYVYEGSGSARPAAATAPTGFTLVAANSATSGNCETGTHVLAVCFETSSGYLSAPGGYVSFSPSGGKKIDLSALPLGPATTAARVIVATKEIIGFTGDFANQEYFTVPGGRVAGNVATTISVSFFDADLQASGDYLLDQLTEIPAGVGLMNYRGHLCVWGENANPSVVRVSKSGQPESHDAVEGFVTVNPGDSGGGVLNCASYRTQLLMFKDERTYVTRDNGQSASFWEVPDPIDSSNGTSCHGIGQVRDFGDNIQDRLFVAARNGLYLFNGSYSEIPASFNIDAIWSRINPLYFHKVEVILDPFNSLIYVVAPLDAATTPNTLLVGDFQEGLETIKWSIDSSAVAPTTIAVDVTVATKVSTFKFGCSTGNVYKEFPAALDDSGAAIASYVQFGHLPFEDEGYIYHFTGVRLRIKGVGNLDITAESEDAAIVTTAASLTLALLPGMESFRGFNHVNEKASVKLSVDAAGEYFTLTKMVLYATIEWETRPE